MSNYIGRWTDSDKIKAHLQSSEIERPTIYDEQLILDSLSPGQLDHNNITDDSEVVKIRTTDILTHTTKILVGTVAQLLSQYIVPGFKGSVFAGSDAIMTVSYVEGKDFVVDYTTGLVKRASTGSAITSGSTVHFWYIPYTIMTKNVDYSIDYDQGQISRIAGTSIPDGAVVAVDYSHSQSTITDALIKEAIIEAEDFMYDRMTSPEASVDAGLSTSATYYTLSVIALSQSLKELKRQSSDSDSIAKQWIALQETYVLRAASVFKKYSKTIDLNLGGSVINNRYPRSREVSRTNPSITATTRYR